MRYLPVVLCSIVLTKSDAQYFSADNVIDSIGKTKFYFFGQLHGNQANILLEKECLFALTKKYGVQYDILEYAHSIAFLFNMYLQTGQDSFLTFINANAKFSFIKTIKAYNDTIGKNKKIRFYGLDFENRRDGKYTRKAMAIILQQTKLPKEEWLFSLLYDMVNSSAEELEEKLKKLSAYLYKNDSKRRALLNVSFIDVLLIANAQYDFSPNRDGPMFDNFKRLYNELLGNGSTPLFFASFGTGHINPSNNRGLARRLSEGSGSPVFKQVSIVGVQYFNCLFLKDSVVNSSNGSVNLMCKNAASEILSFTHPNGKEAITFISKEKLNRLKCNKAIHAFSGLFAIQNFKAAIFGDWE